MHAVVHLELLAVVLGAGLAATPCSVPVLCYQYDVWSTPATMMIGLIGVYRGHHFMISPVIVISLVHDNSIAGKARACWVDKISVTAVFVIMLIA